ncbi:MAG: hypothetical protein A3G75_14075 [Verrucomicrobia bacterium RIFCSPLOWO2_12_FULL_64_8]|nr:MAG: hypothetical protein A3G75_14075 [Verrucomicrobia bacterium RIFCSPLOWO2_12_FULL_64_8]
MVRFRLKLNGFVFLVSLFLGALCARANEFVFNPSDSEGDYDDVWDLDHFYWYTWGIKNFSIPTGHVITEAKLTFFNINNWTAAENNDPSQKLNVWLLDSASNPNRTGDEEGLWLASGYDGKLVRYGDTDNGTDNLAGWSYSAKTKVGEYHDDSGGSDGDVITLTFTFSAAGVLDELNSYFLNGNNFGLGFDPDCHYWNTGVKLKIWTDSPPNVPDNAATLILFGIGFIATVGIRRLISA